MGAIGGYLYLSGKDAVRARQMYELNDYTACGRFCEQSAEKSLKAFIEKNGGISDRPLMKIHKPRRLYERCCELGLEEADALFALQLSVFSEYYYDTNYPGADYFELTEQQAKEAIHVMERVNNSVIRALNR